MSPVKLSVSCSASPLNSNPPPEPAVLSLLTSLKFKLGLPWSYLIKTSVRKVESTSRRLRPRMYHLQAKNVITLPLAQRRGWVWPPDPLLSFTSTNTLCPRGEAAFWLGLVFSGVVVMLRVATGCSRTPRRALEWRDASVLVLGGLERGRWRKRGPFS